MTVINCAVLVAGGEQAFVFVDSEAESAYSLSTQVLQWHVANFHAEWHVDPDFRLISGSPDEHVFRAVRRHANERMLAQGRMCMYTHDALCIPQLVLGTGALHWLFVRVLTDCFCQVERRTRRKCKTSFERRGVKFLPLTPAKGTTKSRKSAR